MMHRNGRTRRRKVSLLVRGNLLNRTGYEIVRGVKPTPSKQISKEVRIWDVRVIVECTRHVVPRYLHTPVVPPGPIRSPHRQLRILTIWWKDRISVLIRGRTRQRNFPPREISTRTSGPSISGI